MEKKERKIYFLFLYVYAPKTIDTATNRTAMMTVASAENSGTVGVGEVVLVGLNTGW
jgi:hypothetical protein